MSMATLSPPGASPVGVPVRPQFNSHITSDRLRVGAGLYTPPFKTGCNIRKGRRSVFKEMGLDDCFSPGTYESPNPLDQQQRSDTFCSTTSQEGELKDHRTVGTPPPRERQASLTTKPWYAKLTSPKA